MAGPDDDNRSIPTSLQPYIEWPVQGGKSIADYYIGLGKYPNAEARARSLVFWESLKAASVGAVSNIGGYRDGGNPE
jgi:hypothetical protein